MGDLAQDLVSASRGEAKEWSHFHGQIEIQRIVALRYVQAQSVSRFDGVDVVRWGQRPAFYQTILTMPHKELAPLL
mgnify:CR=1 FL=1